MPRQSTFPTTYEERRSFSISDLKKGGFIVPGVWKSGTLTWSRNGNSRGSINISVCMYDSPHLQLSYTLDKTKAVKYEVELTKVASNLGKGHVWYFRCPYTGKLCRKLFSVDGYFMHREAVKGYYEKQIQSKKYRLLEKMYGPYFAYEKAMDKVYEKHFKRFYKGKPTKRYAKILSIGQQARSIDESDIYGMLNR